MKKTLLTLCMLAVGAVLGVQADDQTLVNYPTSKDGTAISGTTVEGTVKIHANKDAVSCYTLKNGYVTDNAYNSNSINLTVEGGFKKGDVITIAGAINNSNDTKWGTAELFTMDAQNAITNLKTFENFINSYTATEDPVEQQFTLEADAEKLYLGRSGNTGTNLTLIKVVRPAQETPDPANPEEVEVVELVTPYPIITFVATPTLERSFTVGLNAAGKVQVDWGDGKIVEQTATGAYDGWDNGLEFTGTPTGLVKIWGVGITFFEAYTKLVDGQLPGGITNINVDNAVDLTELDLHQNLLTGIDLSRVTKLQKLTIGVNEMTTLDLSANTELTTLDCNATADGKFTSLDLSNNLKLTTLKANNNKIENIDLSKNNALKNIYLLGNGLTNVTFGQNATSKLYVSLNNNKLETLDVTGLTGLSNGTLLLLNNNLTELKHGAIKTLNITGNRFDLPTLYATLQNVTTPTYANMQDMEIPETIYKQIDLSAQAVINDDASTITWKTASGTALVEGTDYTVADGVYTFIKEQTEQVYAELSNTTALSKLTTPIKTTLATVSTKEAAKDPVITLTAELSDSYNREISVGVPAVGDKVSLDWGDGVLVEAAAVDNWNDYPEAVFTGHPLGEGTIKIYADVPVKSLTAASVVGGVGITSVDVSQAADLEVLELNANKLTDIDLSKNTGLKKLNVANNQLTALDLTNNTALVRLVGNNNQLSEIDLSENTDLNYVMLSTNLFKTIDLSKNLKLKSIYLLNCALTSVALGENTVANYVSLNNNQLTSFDVTALTGLAKGSLFLMNNNLTSLKHGTVKTLNVSGNKFDLPTLYEVSLNVTNLTCANMQDMIIPKTINQSIDMGYQMTVNNEPSTIVWKTESGATLKEGTDYTLLDGVYTFTKEQEEQVYAELSNPTALPKLTTPIKTTLATIVLTADAISTATADAADGEWFNLNGQRVAKPAKGLFIKNGKKVMMK